MTLPELYRELEEHDWFYGLRDDPKIFENGAANAARLVKAATAVKGGPKLLIAFQQHAFSGEPWSEEKKPKPERPTV